MCLPHWFLSFLERESTTLHHPYVARRGSLVHRLNSWYHSSSTLVLSTSLNETYNSSSFILYFGPIIFVQKPACTVCVFPHCFPLQICQLLSHHMKLPSLKYFKKQFCEDPNIQFSTSQPSVSPQYLFFPLK